MRLYAVRKATRLDAQGLMSGYWGEEFRLERSGGDDGEGEPRIGVCWVGEVRGGDKENQTREDGTWIICELEDFSKEGIRKLGDWVPIDYRDRNAGRRLGRSAIPPEGDSGRL